MNYKPILIVLGEPYSVFSELLFKFYKLKKNKKIKNHIILVGSLDLMQRQMKKLNYRFSFNLINKKEIYHQALSKNSINIINVNFNFKKPFDNISNKSKKYISNSFETALDLLEKKQFSGLINGPISKKHYLGGKYPGITEYLSRKTSRKNQSTMIIYNKKFSVVPLTTHIPIKNVAKNISKIKIIRKAMQVKKFFKKAFNKNPKIAILGLNPHCENFENVSEEKKYIIPAINYLKNKKINVSGPFSADTFFLKKNIKKYDLAIGMYHDQVLTPIKTMYNFDAINLTIGLPFLRISPDHGPNNEMAGKNKSNPDSLFSAINFFKNINEN